MKRAFAHRNRLALLGFCLLLAVVVLFYELSHVGHFNLLYAFDSSAVTVPITANRSEVTRRSIAVLVISNNTADLAKYPLAQKTLECYCRHFEYKFLQIAVAANISRWEKLCPHRDFMFRRHCVAVYIMTEQLSAFEYVFFLDGDMGVINPNHLLEEYVDHRYDLIFYSRIFNYEIMAGSYIAKNTDYSRQFLMKWASYDSKVPKSFHGTDNAAIHTLFLDEFCNNCSSIEPVCNDVWKASKDWDGVWLYVACVRLILGQRDVYGDRILVRPKLSPRAWCRDGWLTDSVWGPRDFFFHGWKEELLNRNDFGKWSSPFVYSTAEEVAQVFHNVAHTCAPDRPVYKLWIYKRSYMGTDKSIEATLHKNSAKNFGTMFDYMRKLSTFIYKK